MDWAFMNTIRKLVHDIQVDDLCLWDAIELASLDVVCCLKNG
jgi:hypothetical protein